MGYGLQVCHQANLEEAPIPKSRFNSSVDWHTLGDLHGNALYLLHFLLSHGLARFRYKRSKYRPYYQLFRNIYCFEGEKWTPQNIVEIDEVLAHLEIANHAHIRLLGDVLSDRGMNDYFTLKLIEKIKQNKNAKLEIILSNHDMEFIQRIESERDRLFEELPNSRLRDTSFGYLNPSILSMLNMRYLIENGVIDQAEVFRLYQTYRPSLELLSYDRGARGELMIYSHAPIHELDIFRAALSLVDPINQDKVGEGISQDDQQFLNQLAIHTLSYAYDLALDNQHLLRMIGILNKFAKYLAEQNRLADLFLFKLQMYPDSLFGEMPVMASEGANLPFNILFWSRVDPNARKMNNMVKSTCSFTNVHGHTWGKFDACHNLNQNFARPDSDDESYSIHVSRSVRSPKYVPPQINWPLVAAGAVLFLGIITLTIARVCTGEMSAFFALGSFHMAHHVMKGFPHAAVTLAPIATYFMLKPKPPVQPVIISDLSGRPYRERPSFISELASAFL